MNKIDFKFQLLDITTINDQVEVYKRAFGHNSEKLCQYWRLKHYNNPLGQSLIFGAFYDNKLVGINAFLHCLYSFDDKGVKLLQSCESGVIPEFQGRGIWSKLMSFALDYIQLQTDYRLIIGFPNYRNSYPGFIKMNWNTKYIMNNFIVINNGKSFIETICNSKLLISFGRILDILKLPLKLNVLRNRNIDVKHGTYQFYNIKEKDTVSLSISRSWLDWKINYKSLQVLNAYVKGRVVASCIYGFDKYCDKDIIIVHHIDVLPSMSKHYNGIFSNFINYISKENPLVSFIRIWAMPNKILYKFGFVKTSHPNPFIIMDLSHKYLDKQWALSFLDLD